MLARFQAKIELGRCAAMDAQHFDSFPNTVRHSDQLTNALLLKEESESFMSQERCNFLTVLESPHYPDGNAFFKPDEESRPSFQSFFSSIKHCYQQKGLKAG